MKSRTWSILAYTLLFIEMISSIYFHLFYLSIILAISGVICLVISFMKELQETYNSITDEMLKNVKIDQIYDKIDDLMYDEDYEALEQIFIDNANERDLDYRLSYLTATLPMKNILKNRVKFLEDSKLINDPDNTSDLWNGL